MNRIILVGSIILMGLFSCSKEDDLDQQITPQKLVSPDLTAYVANTDQTTSPMTGFLEIYPCREGTSIYFGNYVEDKKTAFNAFYPIENGEIYAGYYRKLSVPENIYNLVYWGTPVNNNDPIYESPAIKNPEIRIDTDLSKLYLELRKNSDDDTYKPVFDLVYALREKNLANEDLSTSLDRVVAGLKVIVKTSNGSPFSANISKMEVRINGIAEKLNFYTAEPENKTQARSFAAVFSASKTGKTKKTPRKMHKKPRSNNAGDGPHRSVPVFRPKGRKCPAQIPSRANGISAKMLKEEAGPPPRTPPEE